MKKEVRRWLEVSLSPGCFTLRGSYAFEYFPSPEAAGD
jgi:hypothetical protein